jgi:hypothetical protein
MPQMRYSCNRKGYIRDKVDIKRFLRKKYSVQTFKIHSKEAGKAAAPLSFRLTCMLQP